MGWLVLHHVAGIDSATTTCQVVCIVGFLAQFLWEAQAHKVSGRYIIDNVLAQFLWEAQAHKVSGRYIIGNC